MAAIASISINDSVPGAHVFNPIQSVDPATYARNGVVGTPVVGEEQIMLSLKLGARTSEAVNRVKVTLRIPVLETPDGGTPSGYVAPPKVAYHLMCNAEFVLPNRSTAAQREDLRVLMGNLLSNAQVVSLIEDLERPY